MVGSMTSAAVTRLNGEDAVSACATVEGTNATAILTKT